MLNRKYFKSQIHPSFVSSRQFKELDKKSVRICFPSCYICLGIFLREGIYQGIFQNWNIGFIHLCQRRIVEIDEIWTEVWEKYREDLHIHTDVSKLLGSSVWSNSWLAMIFLFAPILTCEAFVIFIWLKFHLWINSVIIYQQETNRHTHLTNRTIFHK